MTGKNGTGKSRILEFISSRFYISDDFLLKQPNNWDKNFNSPKEYRDDCIEYYSSGEYVKSVMVHDTLASAFKTKHFVPDRYRLFPTKMICLSTSPFDRFPTLIRGSTEHQGKSIYSYIGMKNKLNTLSVSSLIKNVMESIFRNPDKLKANYGVIKETLSYLGYGNRMAISYSFAYKTIRYSEFTRDYVKKHFLSDYNELDNENYIDDISRNADDSYNLIDDVYLAFLTLYNHNSNALKKTYNIEINVSTQGLITDEVINAIQVLARAGILKIKTVRLSNKRDNRRFTSFVNASSGEQCLALMILGIASQIENNSLICIDEPEISLHPKWQEEFIGLINKLFSTYTGCQFIIATHSPLIISKLDSKNCFVLDLDRNELVDIEKSSSKSSDYQLATLFKSPGFKNEYLINESLDVLNELSKYKNIELTTRERAEALSFVKEKIDESDPVFSLISTIERVLEVVDDD